MKRALCSTVGLDGKNPPKIREIDWSCLFVSRVRLMVCLSPDGHVRICGVPHGRDPYPSMNSLAGAYFRGRDLNLVYTGFETGLFYFINPTPGHLKAPSAFPNSVYTPTLTRARGVLRAAHDISAQSSVT